MCQTQRAYLVALSALLLVCSATASLNSSSIATRSIQERALQPNSNGICYTYTVQAGDTCSTIAKKYGITVSKIEQYSADTYKWPGCSGTLPQGIFICLSSGDPPMPVALPHATCGPQVPGTTRPRNFADLASLNPCPANECCSKEGLCGTTAEFCTSADGCVSNCGVKSVTTAHPAATKTTSSKTSEKTTSSETSKTEARTSSKTTSSEESKTSSKESTKTTSTEEKKTTSKEESKTTTSTASSSTPTWEIAIYEDKKCSGDYYLVEGHNSYITNDCLVLESDISTDVMSDGVSCRWYTDGGFSWTSCANSKLKRPKSFWITQGQCWVYSDTKCKKESGTVYGPWIGCQNPDTAAWTPSDFVSMMCAAD
ncbi:uncharacterized protein N7459_005769 [Penicillium hispanicum]|uniref:uncharacterized protein n=1 Tax=Penicillium hispanicum TaxID=1080232 RepID=UPI002540B1BB|nr:uncharacterized protein N7459_005769 [Penicillium hispanicum]KAJ5579784.1 hypothetical protein N7459_005769 [Penicillium hispanicum]